MSDKFISDGIESDRYLKAKRLAEQFETDVIAELKHVSSQIVEANPDLFDPDASHDPNRLYDPGTSGVIATLRVDTRMDRVSSIPDSEATLKLNVALEWLNSEFRGHGGRPGETLTCVHYKIKNATSAEYASVREQTSEEDWNVHFGDDAYSGAPSVVYVPVTNYDEVEAGFDVLTEHFATFGKEFGVPKTDDR